jgi:predicted HTH domain antitoxin
MATDRRRVDIDTDELATTIGLYVLGELSLGKAAERVGVTRWEMQELLKEHGVEPRLGPSDMDDAEDEIEAIRDFE